METVVAEGVQEPAKPNPAAGTASGFIRQVKRAYKRKFNAEDKIRIVLEGIRGEHSIAELCRLEKITPGAYYSWSRDFMEAGKARLKGDHLREANRDEVEKLKQDMQKLKELVGEQALEISILKKSLN